MILILRGWCSHPNVAVNAINLQMSCFKNLELQNVFRVKPVSFVDAVFVLLISFNFSHSDFDGDVIGFLICHLHAFFKNLCWLELIF